MPSEKNALKRIRLALDSISLIEVLPGDTNPFRQYPVLKTIWSNDLACLAEEAVDETFEAYRQAATQTPPMPFDEGKLFLIMKNADPIGITGYLPWDETQARIGLRWHGLLPDARGFGLSAKVMDTMRALAHIQYPKAYAFVEFMPIGHNFKSLQDYFEGLGFKRDGPPVTVEWSLLLWQEFVCDITRPLVHKEHPLFINTGLSI